MTYSMIKALALKDRIRNYFVVVYNQTIRNSSRQ